DPDLCARYVGRVAIDVDVRPSPDWMRRRLERCRLRSINNIADITNYVLLEVGQPTHAFDLDALGGAKIIVRRATPGEKLTTLDGIERTLAPENLVIADASRAVALAGVMGGLETEIWSKTRNVLIESAWFDAASIRRTARHFGLHTEASHRFERGADIEGTTWSVDRIAGLLTELASATVLAGLIDAYPASRARQPIPLRAASLRRHLGIDIPASETERILRALGFLVEPAGQGFEVTPPSGRLDVEREIDLVEEVARIYGYDRFPAHLPEWSGHSQPAAHSREQSRLRDTARALGYDEAITYAFDLDTLGGAKIIVRRATPGEKLTTLDGIERTLAPENLVIADASRAVALAGVMGGLETEIWSKTRNVLIESAWFDAASIRRTARQVGLHTEASHRFERGADIEATAWAANRIAGLLTELASATVLAGLIDAYPSKRPPSAILLRAAAVVRHLGVEIPAAEVERILASLGFACARADQGWQVTPPTARLDVEREIDLVEEIARIYGYDRFPPRLPDWAGHSEPAENSRQEQSLRDTARALGYDEAITYAFLSPSEARQFGCFPPVEVRNPLSEVQSLMRNSAVPGILRALEWNLHRGQYDVRLFEIGRLYRAEGKGFAEPPVMALGATGKQRDFYSVKADVTRLLDLFDWKRIYYDRETNAGYYHPGRSARAVADGQTVARFGEINTPLAAERKLRQPVFVAEIWLDRLYKWPPREPHYQPLPRVPAVDRDFSLLLPEGTRWEQVVEAVGEREYLVRLEPVEIRRGDPLPPGKFSLLLRAVWQREDLSLTDEEVNGYARQIVERLRSGLGAEQR
ncbi:MAG: hypothetical protein HY238_21165, partial [Acidobacteria bacterium]|nr:hypothetical protein [Acidobacteriota bacterium]